MKEIRFILLYFCINLIIIDNNSILINNFSNNIYGNFIDYYYNKTHCFKNGPINNFNVINFENCRKCAKIKKKKKSKKCKRCNIKAILKQLKIISPDDTLDEIINKNKSISRFGDGELNLIFGYKIGFQKLNKKLSKRLYEVLQTNEKGLLIGMPDILDFDNSDKFINDCKKYWAKWIKKNIFKLILILNKNLTYYSSFITRFYVIYKDKSKIAKYVEKLKKIWDKKDIVIIEGQKSRLGVNNTLFDNVKSIKRILCPSINAFNLYNKIIKAALKIEKNKLFLLALGPTASILAYDLYKAGYQVIDFGHADIEYELFLRNSSKIIGIPNKFVNEAKSGNKNIGQVEDNEYYNQIIEQILN